jgi:hypothetical protein
MGDVPSNWEVTIPTRLPRPSGHRWPGLGHPPENREIAF